MDRDGLIKLDDKIYNLRTENKDFLRFAYILKDAKIPNWFAPLEIKDISLVDVSQDRIKTLVISEDSSLDLKRRVICECKNNIWFYLREVQCVSISNVTDIIAMAMIFEKFEEG